MLLDDTGNERFNARKDENGKVVRRQPLSLSREGPAIFRQLCRKYALMEDEDGKVVPDGQRKSESYGPNAARTTAVSNLLRDFQ